MECRWSTREVSKLSGLILAWQGAVFLVGADEKDAAVRKNGPWKADVGGCECGFEAYIG
jgi:hypothetical protein